MDIILPYLATCSLGELFRLRTLNRTVNRYILEHYKPEAIDLSGIQSKIDLQDQDHVLSRWLRRVMPTVRHLLCRSALPMSRNDLQFLIALGSPSLQEISIHNGILRCLVGEFPRSEATEDGVDKISRALGGLSRDTTRKGCGNDFIEWPDFPHLESIRWTYDTHCAAFVPTELQGVHREHSITYTLKPCLPPFRKMRNIKFMTLSIGGWFYLYRQRADKELKYLRGPTKFIADFRDYFWMTKEPAGLAQIDRILGSRFKWTYIKHTRIMSGETLLNLAKCRLYNLLDANVAGRRFYVTKLDMGGGERSDVAALVTEVTRLLEKEDLRGCESMLALMLTQLQLALKGLPSESGKPVI